MVSKVQYLLFLECYSHIAGEKYWIISLVVEVITCKSNEFITRGLRPLVITSTTRDIIQYFLPARWESPIAYDALYFCPDIKIQGGI